MKSFLQIETEFGTQPVKWLGGDPDSTALLTLKGRESKLLVSSPNFHWLKGDVQGLLDISLTDERGREVLVHNALPGNRTMPGLRGGQTQGNYTTELFPNCVVVGSDALTSGKKLKSVRFCFNDSRDFFQTHFIKWLPFTDLSEAEFSTLRAIAKRNKVSVQTKPFQIYSVENPKRRLSIRVGDRIYRVHHSLSGDFPWSDSLSVRVNTTLSIQFDAPVSIDVAISRVWEWLGFFDQLALSPHRIESLTATCRADGREAADFYFPNLESAVQCENRFPANASNLPHSAWAQRKQLADLMKGWLDRSDSRRFFRSALVRVISESNQRLDHVDIVVLCAAIESIDEISKKDGKKATLEQRILAIGNAVADCVEGIEWDEFANRVKSLRNAVAHGDWLDENQIFVGLSLVETLTSICCLYDQISSGLSWKSASNRKMPAIARAELNWTHYRFLTGQH